MTREEAKALWNDTSVHFVDRLEALGILKFDKSNSTNVLDALRDDPPYMSLWNVCNSGHLSYSGASTILDWFDAHGFEVVRKK
jgi:hypothetical protein